MAERPRLPSVQSLLNMDPAAAPAAPLESQANTASAGQQLSSANSRQSSVHRPSSLSSRQYASHLTAGTTHNPPPARLPSMEQLLSGQAMNHAQQQPRHHEGRPDRWSSTSHSAGSNSRSGAFPCERCGRMFTRKSDASKHIRVVHDRITPFSCVVCGRKFARKDYCMKHEKSLHNIPPPTSPHQTRKKTSRD